MRSTIWLLIFLSNSVYAQETTPPSLTEEKFAAIVQYAEGEQEYGFKDLITFDKTIEVPESSYLKVITQKRCVAVFYEKTKIQTPKDKNSSWEVVSGSARWICPEDKVEIVNFKNTKLQVQNGEFLITGNQLTVLRDQVQSDNKNLKLETLYVLKNDKWLQLKEQPDPYDLWKKQEKFPAPSESMRVKSERPQDPYVTRVFLNGVPMGLSGVYNYEWRTSASEYNLETHGIRIGTNFPWKNKSIFVFFESIDAENRDNNKNSMGPPPLGNKDIRTEALTFGVGLRHNHVSSSSFYYYLGFTRTKLHFHLHPDASTYYDGEILYPYGLSVGGGYQKIFWSKNWISLMIGADLKITQTLSQGKISYFNQSFPNTVDPRGALTQYAGFLYFGPVFNF